MAPIADHGLLKDLDPHHLHKLATLALEAKFQPRQVIFKEQDTSGSFYLILSGSVAIEIVGPARHPSRSRRCTTAMEWAGLRCSAKSRNTCKPGPSRMFGRWLLRERNYGKPVSTTRSSDTRSCADCWPSQWSG